MGCVLSKKNINDIHPNIFKVMNVDDSGNRLSPGQLEITDNDLILHQQGKNPTKWPLRCLRRYGFDAELFSFESGRRCTTGPGIYAFKCNRAEQLFNLLQSHIQVRNNSNEDNISHDLPLSPSNGTLCASRISTISDSNYLEPRTVCSISNRLNLRNWLNGQSTTGRVTLNSLSAPPLPPKHYINGNIVDNEDCNTADKENCNNVNHHYVNVNVNGNIVLDPPEAVNSYINVDLGQTHEVLSPTATAGNNYIQLDSIRNDSDECSLEQGRVYMNVVPGSLSPTSINSEDAGFSRAHNYMNLESNMVKSQLLSSTKPLYDHTSIGFNTKSASYTGHMNYIVLDLDSNQSDPNPSPSSLHSNNHLFESNKPSEGYATIDFDRTVALSHTVVPNVDNDKEGCRKTRHHSTVAVSDIHLLAFPPRGSSSLSD